MPTQIPVGLKFRRPNEPLGLVGKLGQMWDPKELIFDIKALRELAYSRKFKGPFILLMSSKWIPYLDLLMNPWRHVIHHNADKRVGDVVLGIPGIKEISTSDIILDFQCALYED